jgi:hypothetical protein
VFRPAPARWAETIRAAVQRRDRAGLAGDVHGGIDAQRFRPGARGLERRARASITRIQPSPEQGLGDRKAEAGGAAGDDGNAAIGHDGLPSILNALAFAAGLNALASCDLAQNQAARKRIAEGLVFQLKAGNKPSEDG